MSSAANSTRLEGREVKVGALFRAGVTKAAKEVTRDEWARILTPFQFAVLREAHTERAGSGQYVKTKEPGTYHCGACGAVLFHSEAKFESRCGWPSFSRTASSNSTSDANVAKRKDCSYGLTRTEIYCRSCNSHLGHLFDDGPRPTGERYCANSAALEFVPAEREKR